MNVEMMGATVPGSWVAPTTADAFIAIERKHGLAVDTANAHTPRGYYSMLSFYCNTNFTTEAELRKAIRAFNEEYSREALAKGINPTWVINPDEWSMAEMRDLARNPEKYSVSAIAHRAGQYVYSLTNLAKNAMYNGGVKHPISHYQSLPMVRATKELGITHQSMVSSAETKYASNTASIPDAIASGFKVRSPYDNIWWHRKYYWRGSNSDAHYRVGGEFVTPRNKQEYWTTLSYITDPEEYINMLKMYKSANVSLKYYKSAHECWVPSPYQTKTIKDNAFFREQRDAGLNTYIGQNGVKVTSGAGDMTLGGFTFDTMPTLKFDKDRVDMDRFIYAEMIRRFYEVVYFYHMQTTQTILDYSKQEDLSALETAHSFILNRRALSLSAVINTPIEVRLRMDGNERYKYFWATIPDNFVDGPEIHFPEEGLVLNCKQALLKMQEYALSLVEMNLNKLEARIAELRDPQGLQHRDIEVVHNPTENMFLVYNAEESRKAGQPMYTNVATNLTNVGQQGLEYAVHVDKSPRISHYEQSSDIRAGALRQYETAEGIAYSMQDFKNLGIAPKKGTITPWLIGGGVVALGLAQVLG